LHNKIESIKTKAKFDSALILASSELQTDDTLIAAHTHFELRFL